LGTPFKSWPNASEVASSDKEYHNWQGNRGLILGGSTMKIVKSRISAATAHEPRGYTSIQICLTL